MKKSLGEVDSRILRNCRHSSREERPLDSSRSTTTNTRFDSRARALCLLEKLVVVLILGSKGF